MFASVFRFGVATFSFLATMLLLRVNSNIVSRCLAQRFCRPDVPDVPTTMSSTDPRWQFEAWRREFYVVGTLLPPPWSHFQRG
ncbi:MAG TPA: hypothetical protein DCE43_24475 [Planctomycetaceae bacterium]|nr:hypothetical protein [Planctomycetaceae bacterium]HCK55299.1 hypothetical protein [Planctomycetaceae bacterium]